MGRCRLRLYQTVRSFHSSLLTCRSQINWFLNTSASIQPIERPFQPDGTTDLGHIWRRSSPSRLPRAEKTLAKPNAMMWFHIPLPEAYDTPDTDSNGILQVGTHDDGKGASKTNSGLFYNGIKEAFEAVPGGDGMELPVSEVKVLGHGHTHNTDMCKRVNGIWYVSLLHMRHSTKGKSLTYRICFDGGSSFSGYGKIGFDRRVRIYEISDYGETISTYKRLSSRETVDKQVLVGDGAPAGAGI
jgi:hypothetical protein